MEGCAKEKDRKIVERDRVIEISNVEIVCERERRNKHKERENNNIPSPREEMRYYVLSVLVIQPSLKLSVAPNRWIEIYIEREDIGEAVNPFNSVGRPSPGRVKRISKVWKKICLLLTHLQMSYLSGYSGLHLFPLSAAAVTRLIGESR